MLCMALSCVLVVFVWKNILSPPDASTPAPDQESLFDYPDSFALRAEYLEQFSIKSHSIRRNDTLQQVLQELGIPLEYAVQWLKSSRNICELNKLRPNDHLTIHVRLEDQQPTKFIYTPVDGDTYTFRRAAGGWECQKDGAPPFPVIQTVKGVVTDNLYDSGIRAGLPAGLIMELTDLFAYDIDFVTDLRRGDTFAVHFEQQVREGKRVSAGPVLAAEMVVGGQRYKAFYYELPDGYKGYFDAGGSSLRKLFLKAPLSYSRISSTFTYKRFHPILKINRPHLGIDYAAPQGTPISALGDGVITFLGRKGGFGRYVEVRHNGEFKTTYGHLLKYAAGLRKGSKVAQGQVIGYVGASGLATGPHLDFRFYKHGKPVDFLKTEFPRARSIPKAQMADFAAKCEIYLAALRGSQYAKNESDVSSEE